MAITTTLTSAQACEALGVSKTTLYRLQKAGRLTPVKVGRFLRFREDQVAELLGADVKDADPEPEEDAAAAPAIVSAEFERQGKAIFVDTLARAYRYVGEVDDIWYSGNDDLEVVYIKYPGGHIDRIDVTCNSHIATAKEIALQLSGGRAIGLMDK